MAQRVVVIGGGIVGLSCAFFLKREGFDVTVIDPGEAEGRASYGNAGVLAFCEQLPLATPELMFQLPRLLLSSDSPLQVRWRYLPSFLPWMVRFAKASSSDSCEQAVKSLSALMSLALHAHIEIANAAGARDLLRFTGWIKAWQRAPKNAASKAREVLHDLGVGMQDLSASDLTDLAPGFHGVFDSATLFNDCYQIASPGRYLERISAACESLGIRFVRGKVTDFHFENAHVRGVHTNCDPARIDADYFVIAGGAWSKDLAARLGDDVPLDTERGYHLMLDVGSDVLLRAPLLWQDKSIVFSQMQDGLRMTSSVEFAGLHAPPRYENIERSFASVRRIVPALSDTRVRSRWLGFRPSMPDSVPVIGRASKHANCLLAFGHGHLGLTLGPATGKLIAGELTCKAGPIDLDLYSPLRFVRRDRGTTS